MSYQSMLISDFMSHTKMSTMRLGRFFCSEWLDEQMKILYLLLYAHSQLMSIHARNRIKEDAFFSELDDFENM